MISRLDLDIKIQNTIPTAEEFAELRALIGWGETDINTAAEALKNSLFHVTARLNSKLVGMGRVIGDNAMFFYIQDVVVDPSYQNKGIGHLLMEQIEGYLAEHAQKGATVGLFSANGKEAFYTRYGYAHRNGNPLGYGMCKFL